MKYPENVLVRLSEKDMENLTKAADQLDIPRSALVRRAWREWLKQPQANGEFAY